MTTISPDDLWVADILFTDQSASKRRPVLVLWLDGNDTIVAAVTSASPRSNADVALNDWQTSGLRVPSTVRLSRLDCLEQSLLLFRLGALSQADAQRILQAWQQHVQPRF